MLDGLSPAETQRIQLARTVLDPVRMWILERCECVDGEVSVDQLSQELATQVTGSADGGDVDHHRISLAHVELPKLADLGLIEYNHERGTVGSNDALDGLDEVVHTGRHFVTAIDRALARGDDASVPEPGLQDV